MMSIRGLLLIGLLLVSTYAVKVLRGDEIPKEYPIGRIYSMDFTADGRLFFYANDTVLGFMNAKTGEIVTLYEL